MYARVPTRQVHIYIYTYIYIDRYIHIDIDIDIDMCVCHTYIHIYIHTCVWMPFMFVHDCARIYPRVPCRYPPCR